MVSEKKVMNLFWKAQDGEDGVDDFNKSVLEYFLDRVDDIIDRYGSEGHEERVEALRRFYHNFEKGRTPDDPEPDDILEPDIMGLFVRVNAELSGEAFAGLRKEALGLLEAYD
ncbi:hypothetical protein KY362_06655 [Candidatus Woesearchaeota archaeon]|nr:hypothetical protein [Candidatus Woesearchaeota archaeon]